MAETRAQKNRKVRQDAIREQLAAYGHHTQLVNTIEEMLKLDPESPTFTNELAKYRTVNEQRLKLINKYLPDLKATEITGEGGEPFAIDIINYAEA